MVGFGNLKVFGAGVIVNYTHRCHMNFLGDKTQGCSSDHPVRDLSTEENITQG